MRSPILENKMTDHLSTDVNTKGKSSENIAADHLTVKPVSVQFLQCEYLDHPVGIDVKNPRLDWKLTSDRRRMLQKAYQVPVSNWKKTIPP
jgi:hypothetical protein